MSELQDVTKALEKFTFNSPLNEARAAAEARNKFGSNSLSQKQEDQQQEDQQHQSSHRRPDLVLPTSSSPAAADSHYARPKSLSSPKSPLLPYGDSASDNIITNNGNHFFSGSELSPNSSNNTLPSEMGASNDNGNRHSTIVQPEASSTYAVHSHAAPEPAHAVLVSSSVQTYEPKTNFCRPVLHPPQHAVLPNSITPPPPTTTTTSSSNINMYSDDVADAEDDSLSVSAATTAPSAIYELEEDEEDNVASTASSTTARKSASSSSAMTPTTFGLAIDDTLSPLVNQAPSTFHTFGANDDEDDDADEGANGALSSSRNAEEGTAPSSSSGSASATYPVPFNKLALPPNKLSAIGAFNCKSPNHLHPSQR